MVVLQLSYPLSLLGESYNALYFTVYLALLASGVFVASVTRARFLVTAGLALINVVIGIPWVLGGTDGYWLTLAAYSVLTAFQGLIIYTLMEYIFSSVKVTRSVIYASLTVYALLGNMFSALFMIVQTLDPMAFASSGSAELPLVWQHMVYFSYSTLTTAGYGDIVPRSAWAQSIASTESMLGLLYIAVIIGRLVSGYRDDKEVA